jgi:uncharacterized NAD(P)/FAD-binding protein YdhS
VPHLLGRPGFYNSPYPAQDMASAIPPLAPVCILGTGLSAIDAVLSLSAAGHRGKLILASRNGRLPSVRGSFNQSRSLSLTRDSVDAMCEANGGVLSLDVVFAALQKEVMRATGLACDLQAIMNPGAGILDYITSEIALADSVERLWQSVIYSTNGVIDYIWHRLSDADKRRFQNTFGSLWSSYRVSFPLKNAKRIHALLRADRVLVFGGVKSTQYNEESNLFETRIDVARSQVPLVGNLLRRKLAVPNEFGGFNLDFETGSLVDATGTVARNISVLGSLAAGTYFWTNAMDVNVRLARGQVNDTLRALGTVDRRPERPISIRPLAPVAAASLATLTPNACVQDAGANAALDKRMVSV